MLQTLAIIEFLSIFYYKRNAKKRNIDFNLTFEEFDDITNKIALESYIFEYIETQDIEEVLDTKKAIINRKIDHPQIHLKAEQSIVYIESLDSVLIIYQDISKQELAKDKEPYLEASKEIIKRIKGSTKYKNNKDDEKFMNSVKQTFMYIDNLKHSEATLQQTIDAFEQLKTYAHETFNIKNETIQKLVEPFVGIKEETKEIKQELDKTDKNMDSVAKKADQVNQATQEQAQAESKVVQQVEAQAQAQSKAKDDAKATAEAMESQAKSQKTITETFTIFDGDIEYYDVVDTVFYKDTSATPYIFYILAIFSFAFATSSLICSKATFEVIDRPGSHPSFLEDTTSP